MDKIQTDREHFGTCWTKYTGFEKASLFQTDGEHFCTCGPKYTGFEKASSFQTDGEHFCTCWTRSFQTDGEHCYMMDTHQLDPPPRSVCFQPLQQGVGPLGRVRCQGAQFRLLPSIRLRPKLSRRLLPTLPEGCLLYTSPSPRDDNRSRMPSSA